MILSILGFTFQQTKQQYEIDKNNGLNECEVSSRILHISCDKFSLPK